jgi:hypothetical protein
VEIASKAHNDEKDTPPHQKSETKPVMPKNRVYDGLSDIHPPDDQLAERGNN